MDDFSLDNLTSVGVAVLEASRQEELRSAIEKNIASVRPPCTGVHVESRHELAWPMAERGWSGEPLANGRERADLRGIVLAGVDLHGFDLFRANLSGASLVGADLSEADLFQADLSSAILIRSTLNDATLFQTNLSGADMYQAHLRGANLFLANLTGAFLRSADATSAFLYQANLNQASALYTNFADADLQEATLTGINLSHADLRGCCLVGARLDPAAVLSGIKLDGKTCLSDVFWNGAPLVNVDWSQAAILGDESAIEATSRRSRQRRVQTLRQAARAYRGLSLSLRAQGLHTEASGYRMREQRMRRQEYLAEHKVGSWLFSWILNLVAGYGEEPQRAALAYILTISGFAAAYASITRIARGTRVAQLSWDQALVLSLTSFHGRGFFPGTLPLNDWVARCAAAEAVFGLFIELIFIATFSRRFLTG